MSYIVFAVDDEDVVDALYEDDLVSRQSITVRDASAIDLDGDERYVLVEGSDDALEKAEELLADDAEVLGEDDAEEVFDAIKDAEQSGAEGMGAIFG